MSANLGTGRERRQLPDRLWINIGAHGSGLTLRTTVWTPYRVDVNRSHEKSRHFFVGENGRAGKQECGRSRNGSLGNLQPARTDLPGPEGTAIEMDELRARIKPYPTVLQPQRGMANLSKLDTGNIEVERLPLDM